MYMSSAQSAEKEIVGLQTKLPQKVNVESNEQYIVQLLFSHLACKYLSPQDILGEIGDKTFGMYGDCGSGVGTILDEEDIFLTKQH